VSKRPTDTRGAASVVPSETSTAAVSQLVEANLRLVVNYAHRFHGCGLPLVELIHAGNLGLIEAARRFDSSRDAAFVSFASWWVRQAMLHAMADRAGAQPMPVAALATPTVDRLSSTLPAVLDGPGGQGEPGEPGEIDGLDPIDDDADFDETFAEIQSRANGTPRHADRLRSHLN
jgi:RNA polymerase sigma factor (sigma-70 family)